MTVMGRIDVAMHLNSCLMIGRVSPKGAQLRYAESGTPLCSFVLEVDEVSNGKTFTTYIPCEVSGKYAEQTSVEVEPGDVLQVSGKWKYKPVVDQKSGAKGLCLIILEFVKYLRHIEIMPQKYYYIKSKHWRGR